MSMDRRLFALMVSIALIPRLILLFAGPWQDLDRAKFDDSRRHLVLADNLKQFGSFGLAQEEPARAWSGVFELRQANGTLPAPDAHGLYPEAFRTPGYPVFLIATGALTGGDYRGALLVQCILGALAAGCLYGMAVHLGFTRRAAIVAGALWALHPGLVDRDCQFMTESLFISLGVFAVYLSLCGPRGWQGWLLCGFCLGFAGLVRPLAVLYLPAVIPFLWRSQDRRWLASAIVIVLTVAPSLGWCARNAAVGNGFRLTTVGDMTFLYHFAGYSISEERGEDWLEKWPDRCDELLNKLETRLEPGDDVFTEMRKLGVEEVQARPQAATRVLLKSWAKLFLAPSVGELYQLLGKEYRSTNLMARYILRENVPGPAPPVADVVIPLAWTALNVSLLVLSVAGTLRGIVRRRFGVILPLLAIMVLFTAATVSQGMERFRSPMMFAQILLAVACFGLPRSVAHEGNASSTS